MAASWCSEVRLAVARAWPLLAALLAGCATAPFDARWLGDQVTDLVREHFYDAARGEAWAVRHRGYGNGLVTREQFAATTQALLQELQASHTGYFTVDDPYWHGLRAVFCGSLGVPPPQWDSIGVDVTEDGFVRQLFVGGAAEQARLLRGDRIVAADGQPFAPVASLRGRAGQNVHLTIERRPGERLDLTVVPRHVGVADEWRTAQQQGARVVEVNHKRIAVMPLFSGAGDVPVEVLKEALAGKFADADALVLDFRNGFGGCNPDFVSLFDPAVPQLAQTERDGTVHVFAASWRKPLVVVENAGSRSGKELVLRALQRSHRAVLVGEPSGGAVLGGRPFLLADGALLYLAVADVQVDGERFEGRPVQPDVQVEDRLQYAAGADPQLDRALQVAAEQASR